MNIYRQILRTSACGLFAIVVAQIAVADQATLVEPASLNNSYYLGDEPSGGVEPAICESCQSDCSCRGCATGLLGNLRSNWGCPQGQPWTLPQPGVLEAHKIRLGGWLQQGITFNAQDPSPFNGPVATNDLDSEYLMNQMWLYLHRQADNGGCGWAWGGHIDVLYGSDWRFGFNNGLETEINGFNRQTYGIVIPQAYLEFAVNKLSVKLGHFAGILDYEVVPGPPNPLYSHSYGYGYGVPQLVTGMMADYKLTDQLSIQSGFHRGWMQFEDNNNKLDYMGGVKWISDNERLSLAYALSTGPQDDAGQQERFVHSLVAKLSVTEKLQYILVQNLGSQKNSPQAGDTAEWYGINQYFLYQINPCWAAVLRAEWFRDDDGMRVAGPGNVPGIRAFDGRGFAGNFYEVTAGLNWRPLANLLVRPEIRYDWFDGPAGPTGLPFDDGNSDDQLLFGVDAVLTF
jgi:hypothetical protein